MSRPRRSAHASPRSASTTAQGYAIGRPIPLADVLTELPLPSDATAERRAAAGDDDAWYAAGSR